MALQYAKSVGRRTAAIVGRDGGYAAKVADACVIIPTVNPVHVTPHSEAFQAVVWHLLVSHPASESSRKQSGNRCDELASRGGPYFSTGMASSTGRVVREGATHRRHSKSSRYCRRLRKQSAFYDL